MTQGATASTTATVTIDAPVTTGCRINVLAVRPMCMSTATNRLRERSWTHTMRIR
jgi:hypothetical protein